MPPKKPSSATPPVVTEARSPLDIELDKAVETLNGLSDQLSRCKDGLAELSTLATKIRMLEQEMQPKEAELKNIQSSFLKCVEAASSLKRPTALLRTQQSISAASGGIDDDQAASMTITANAMAPNSRPQTVAAPMINGNGTTSAAAPDKAADKGPVAPQPPTTADESADREVVKMLAVAAKSYMQPILQSVLDAPATPSEKRAEAEGIDLATLVTQTRRADTPRVDLDLTCPIGIEPSVFFDVLKIRAQKIVVERSINEVATQVNDAKAQVTKRKDEGISKLLQKRLEKQIEDAQKRVAQLQKERDDYEQSRRVAAAMDQHLSLHRDDSNATPMKKDRSQSKIK